MPTVIYFDLVTDVGPLGLAGRNVPSGFPASSRDRERWATREDGVSRKDAASVKQQAVGRIEDMNLEEKYMQLPIHCLFSRITGSFLSR